MPPNLWHIYHLMLRSRLFDDFMALDEKLMASARPDDALVR